MDKPQWRKEAFKAYRERVGEWFPVSLALLIVACCCAALSLLGWIWMLLGIALLFLPTLFAATQYLGASLTEKPAETNLITHAFAAYFKTPCIGVYRFFFNGLMTFLASAGTGAACVMLYYLISVAVDPNFAAVVDSITSAIYAGDYDAALRTIDTSGSFALMYDLSEIVMGFAMAFFAWLFFGHYAQNGILRNAFHLQNPRLANFYYRHYRQIVKKEWNPTRAPFLLIPILFLALGGVVSAICYVYGAKANFALFFGLLTFAVLYSFYLPFILYLHVVFSFAHQKSIGKAFYVGSQRIYQMYASSGRASEEELARMREELDKIRPDDDSKEDE